MKKEIFNVIGKEIMFIGSLFLLSLIIFKIVFYKEELYVLLRIILSLFWLFVLPGYFLMLYWREKIEFLERFIIGIALSAAIIGVLSYYTGLAGLNIKYHSILMPIALITMGIIISLKREG